MLDIFNHLGHIAAHSAKALRCILNHIILHLCGFYRLRYGIGCRIGSVRKFFKNLCNILGFFSAFFCKITNLVRYNCKPFSGFARSCTFNGGI